MLAPHLLQLQSSIYLACAALFSLGLKLMSRADTAKRGNALSSIGMLAAIVATLLAGGLHWQWIMFGMLLGSIIGLLAAYKIPMTGIPGMVALLNGSGGLASLLLGIAEYHSQSSQFETATEFALVITILIGAITASGSVIAWGKLSEKLPNFQLSGQHLLNGAILVATLGCAGLFLHHPSTALLYAITAMSLVLGILAVMPIGGADMPVVISLLNSYSGIASCAAGFVVDNPLLIIAGALVGASGIILTHIMCKAMNRQLSHVLFSGFKTATSGKQTGQQQQVQASSAEDAYFVLEAAQRVVIVPGYGLAVAQAQHALHELDSLLSANGCEVRYAIHPVAGRMPGHMNVLLAEANIPYAKFVEMDDINPQLDQVDVCIVVGANDVVNLSARDDADSVIAGMPIIEVDKARTTYVIKRSMSPGYAGIDNPLFSHSNNRMLFGDAKAIIQGLVEQFKT